VQGTMVHFSFYIYDIIEFDLLIGQPIRRLIQEGQTGKLKISLGKNFRDNSFIAIKNYNDSLVAIRKLLMT
jgi:hypothetical protein